jgi:hypothetical protein
MNQKNIYRDYNHIWGIKRQKLASKSVDYFNVEQKAVDYVIIRCVVRNSSLIRQIYFWFLQPQK